MRVTRDGSLYINLGQWRLDMDGVRRFCDWLPGYMERLQKSGKSLVWRAWAWRSQLQGLLAVFCGCFGARRPCKEGQ